MSKMHRLPPPTDDRIEVLELASVEERFFEHSRSNYYVLEFRVMGTEYSVIDFLSMNPNAIWKRDQIVDAFTYSDPDRPAHIAKWVLDAWVGCQVKAHLHYDKQTPYPGWRIQRMWSLS